MERDEVKAAFPALYQAVYDTGGWWRPNEDCQGCPFNDGAGADRGRFIICRLQSALLVFARQPSCTEKMWQVKAREELDAVGKRLPLIG